MDIDYNDALNFTIDLAVQAGKLIKEKRYRQDLSFDFKDNVEVVTSADIAADELITCGIKKHFPKHAIFSEESSPDFFSKEHASRFVWIIDPIDGTVNYSHNLDQVCISIALAVDGVVQVGVVHSPFQNETFSAIKGKGAFLNNRNINCSSNKDLKTAIIATGFPYDKSNIEYMIQRFRRILANFQDIRRFGSAALDICWVACGKFDGYYETVHPWDLAAASLIAKEAGCSVGNLYRLENNIPEDLRGENLIVASPGIYSALVKVLKEADSVM